MYFLYSLLMGLLVVLLTPYWLAQGLRHRKYFSNLGQRLGFSFPTLHGLQGREGTIWIHAVSVGEALSGVTLAKQLKKKYPERCLVMSTTTLTGQAVARERFPFADAVFYFPLDWAFCVRRALLAVRPSVVIVLETEIWPNFLRETSRAGVSVVFVSGRISDRSFQRWKRFAGLFGFFLLPFFRNVLGKATAFLMQSEKDAERVKVMGAPPERVEVSGNLKYDQELPQPTPMAKWLEREAKKRGRAPVIVAGSVVANEETPVLIAFGTLQGDYPKALLVLAPRKPECFDAAAVHIEDSHRKFVRRSQIPVARPGGTAGSNGDAAAEFAIADDVTVILLDSIGELASLYAVADGAFVGGSLVESGGHNILEPAAFGKVPVFGPSMENFAEMAARFVGADAAVQVESPEDAGVAWIEFMRDAARTKRMSEAARGLVASSQGATARAVQAVAAILSSGGPAREKG